MKSLTGGKGPKAPGGPAELAEPGGPGGTGGPGEGILAFEYGIIKFTGDEYEYGCC